MMHHNRIVEFSKGIYVECYVVVIKKNQTTVEAPSPSFTRCWLSIRVPWLLPTPRPM